MTCYFAACFAFALAALILEGRSVESNFRISRITSPTLVSSISGRLLKPTRFELTNCTADVRSSEFLKYSRPRSRLVLSQPILGVEIPTNLSPRLVGGRSGSCHPSLSRCQRGPGRPVGPFSDPVLIFAPPLDDVLH